MPGPPQAAIIKIFQWHGAAKIMDSLENPGNSKASLDAESTGTRLMVL
jgi:hypothetical protein